MRGIALLLVIWVLALLGILAAVFVSSSQTESSITRNFADEQIAKNLAISGIEYGISKINLSIEKSFVNSFGQMESSWTNEQVIENPTGTMTLRINDLQGRININDGLKYPIDHSINKNVERMLNTLGKEQSINMPNLGTTILQSRPTNGYQTDYDIKRVLGTNYEKVQPHVTHINWQNNQVATPVPLSETVDVATYYPIRYLRPTFTNGQSTSKIYRRGHNKDKNGNLLNQPLRFYTENEGPDIYNSAIFSYDSLNPQWIEIVSRSPVNINTASKEVLTALITDLQGYYVQERRAPSPVYTNVGPLKLYVQTGQTNLQLDGNLRSSACAYNYNFSSDDHYHVKVNGIKKKISNDHLGILQITNRFNALDGIDPSTIANEIIKQRSGVSAFPVNGPIQTWAHFNHFIDWLVQQGIIYDSRNRFFDLWMDPSQESKITTAFKNSAPLDVEAKTQSSNIQRRIASQAAGDVLKANFNPNLNLNELNPNHNISSLVDKTDLLVNSTEFCFLPMGYFQIDSQGKYMAEGKTISSKKISSTLKFYDIHYETAQKDFYKGTFGGNSTSVQTNNGTAVETGPEPDNGKAPSENEYSGYITLSSHLGVGQKTKGDLFTTYHKPDVYTGAITSQYPTAQEGYNSDLHVHFQLDHVAHYHKFGQQSPWPQAVPSDMSFTPEDRPYQVPVDPPKTLLPVGPFEGKFREWSSEPTGFIMKISTMNNLPDRDETLQSPYSPVNGDKYRLCRSFKYPNMPSSFPYEPSDLRIDGAYLEFNSSVSYHTPFKFPVEKPAGYNFICAPYSPSELPKEMFMSFFIKPNFYPECSERIRQFVTTNSYGFFGYGNDGIYLHGLYWLPAAHSNSTILPTAFYSFPPRASFVYNVRLVDELEYVFPYTYQSPLGCLNHIIGVTQQIFATPLTWEYSSPVEDYNKYYGTDSRYNRLRKNEWVHVMLHSKVDPNNERRLSTSKQYINLEPFDDYLILKNWSFYWPISYQTTIGYGPFISLGGECTSAFNWVHKRVETPAMSKPETRYYYADSTIDEYFVWFNNNDQGLLASERIFSLYGRYYKPLDSQDDGTFTSQTINLNKPSRILGISWTVYAEDYELVQGKLLPVFLNYQANPPDRKIVPTLADANGYNSSCCALMYLLLGNNALGPLGNDGYSPVDTATKAKTSEFKYKLKFRLGIEDRLETTLMSTPVLDDVTVFYTRGTQVLSYIIY